MVTEIRNNILGKFNNLTFDEASHTYYVEGKPLQASVSKVIGNFYEKFDSKGVAERISRRDGIPVQDILDDWDKIAKQACDLGHKVHLFGEHYPFDRSLKPSCNKEIAVTKFWNDIPEHIVPVLMECRMYHKEYLFAGTADILLYDTKKNYYILGDYKTNKDLFKNYKNKTLKAPFNHLFDSPFNKYQIQLSLYQILLEQIGIYVGERKLIWLKDSGDYVMYDTEDLTSILKPTLKEIYAS